MPGQAILSGRRASETLRRGGMILERSGVLWVYNRQDARSQVKGRLPHFVLERMKSSGAAVKVPQGGLRFSAPREATRQGINTMPPDPGTGVSRKPRLADRVYDAAGPDITSRLKAAATCYLDDVRRPQRPATPVRL